MELNLILPFVTTTVMVVFTVSVFQRWFFRRRDYFFFWGVGLGMFTAASFAEAYFAAAGWSSAIFFIWYFFGAVLTAAWIGHGTYLLLVRKSWRHVVTGGVDCCKSWCADFNAAGDAHSRPKPI